jgi:hypothetical protein
MSKREEIIRKLYKDGWRVDNSGNVIKPDGTIRNTSQRKVTGGRIPYLKFNVKFNDKSYPVNVHHLCSYQKYGEQSFLVECTRHLDGNCINNSPENIALGSHSENQYDRSSDSRLEHAKKGSKKQQIFTEEQILEIRNSKESLKTISERFGCAKSTISDIRNFKTYKEYGGMKDI